MMQTFRSVMMVIVVVSFLLITGTVYGQESPEPPVITQTPEPCILAEGQTYVVQEGDTLSQVAQQYGITPDELVVMNCLSTEEELEAGQEIQVPFIPPTATLVPSLTPTPTLTPTPAFPNLTVQLTIDPPASSYKPGDTITFEVRVTNPGGDLLGRDVDVVLSLDQALLLISNQGSAVVDGGLVTWTMTSIAEGEENARDFTLGATVRSDLTENAQGEIRVLARTRSTRIQISNTVTERISILVPVSADTPTETVKQGTGLFADEANFTRLIGWFFGFAIFLTAFLSGIGIWFSRNSPDNIQHILFNTVEILILLIVIFSVIVMGVQNTIDRESINAIIGGIVGYIAGRSIRQLESISPPTSAGEKTEEK